jgi:MtN3 and saliva related transmembrane protein
LRDSGHHAFLSQKTTVSARSISIVSYKIYSKMNATDLVGTIAACLTTFSFLPQAIKTFRTKDVSGISLSMYGIFTVGVALWLVYGILLGAWPIIISNAITVSLALSILLMKLRYR